MILFVKLILAHFIGNFLWQPSAWVTDKEIKKQKSIYLYLHPLLHFALACILVAEIKFVWFAFTLALLHGIIDFIKIYFQKSNTKRLWFATDQVAHLVVIVLIASIYKNLEIDFSFFNERFWVIVTAILFLTKPTSMILKNSISIWTPEDKSTSETSLQNAGNYIGILERLFVFLFIITNHFEAIGFLLAAKSIFRFGDLKDAKDRKLTEYVLIGTLLSFGIALLIGLLIQFVLAL